MSNYVLPILIVALFVFAIIKKVNTYSVFVSGATKSLTLIADIFAYILTIFIALELFTASGLSVYFCKALSPIFSVLGIPTELTELIIVKPFSGSGGLALLTDVYQKYGADSYISRCASVIFGSSETVFYVATVYFSKTKIKKLGFAIPVAMLCLIFSVIISCLICRFI